MSSPPICSVQRCFGRARRVVGDHRVGGVEDALARAVVLLHDDDRRLGEHLLELQQVPEVGPTEFVDRLILVADHHHVAVLLARASAPAPTARRWCPGTRRPARGGSAAPPLPASAWSRNRCTVCTSRSSKSSADASSSRRWYSRYTSATRFSGGVNARSTACSHDDQLVLQRRDRAVQPARREALRVEVEVAPHVVDQADGVGLVVDRERRPVAEHAAPRAAGCASTSSGRSTPTCARRPGRPARATRVLHLAGGLVGERDRGEAERRHAAARRSGTRCGA